MARATTTLKQRAMLAFFVAGILFVAISATRLTYRHWTLKSDLSAVEQEIAELEQEREELSGTLSALDSVEAIERQAREVLNLQRKGEQVVILLPTGEPAPIEGAEAAPEEAPEPSNPVKWWAYFFGAQ
jgi:cell division protein FtsB